jgi:excisionase family DNA binding protein
MREEEQIIESATPSTTVLLSVPTVAKRCSVSEKTVYGWVGDRKLDSVRIGKRLLVTEKALAEFIDRSKVQ